MKTIYQGKNRNAKQGRYRRYIAVLVLAAIFLLLQLFPSVWLSDFVYAITTPFLHAKQFFLDGFSEVVVYLSSKSTLAYENEILSNSLKDAQERLLYLDTLKRDNELLKNFLSRNDQKQRLLAAVLTRPPLSPYDTLVLDVGLTAGVKIGTIVVSSGGTAIGEITEVFRNFSRVTLFSSPGRKTPVFIGADNVSAVAEGAGGGSFNVLLPREIDIQVGDAVTTTGLTPPFLGTVASVENRVKRDGIIFQSHL